MPVKRGKIRTAHPACIIWMELPSPLTFAQIVFLAMTLTVMMTLVSEIPRPKNGSVHIAFIVLALGSAIGCVSLVGGDFTLTPGLRRGRL